MALVQSSRGQRHGLTSLIVAALAGHLGQGIVALVLPLIAVTIDDSPVAVSGITLSLTLPWLAFGLVSGVVVDRVDRRRLLIAVATARLAAISLLVLLVALDRVTIPSLYLVALTMGITETLLEPGLIATIPMVTPPERLAHANARIIGGRLMVENVAQAVAGALAGIGLIVATGASWLALCLTLAMLFTMHGRFRAETAHPETFSLRGLRDQIGEGVRALLGAEPLRTITLTSAAINAAWAAWWSVWVLYAVKPGPVGLSSAELGVLLGIGSVSSFVGTALALPIQHRFGPRWAIGVNIFGNALLFGLSAATSSVVPIAIAVICGEFGGPGWGIAANELQQRRIPEQLRGRVASAYRFIGFGAKSIGALAGGVIASATSIPALYACCAAVTVATLIPFLRHVTNGAMRGEDQNGNRRDII
jgi:MFS family permease